MEKIRVLHVVSSLSKSSGVMSVIMNYYRNVNKNNVQFDFLFFKEIENTHEKEIKSHGGKVFCISRPSLFGSFKKEFADIINKNRHVVIHIHEVYLTPLLSPVAKKNGVTNIITHSHTTMYSDKFISSIRNRLLCLRLKKHANYYFACSKAAGEFLYGKKSLDAGAVVVVNNAVDCKKIRFNRMVRNNIRKALGLEKDLIIGHVGRFNKVKNHMFLIEIFVELMKKENQVKLILIGEGPLFKQIKEKVNQLNISDDVVLLGKRDDIPDLLQGMDIFLLPSLSEGLPVVGVEAQVSGLPIVMSSNITKEIGLLNYQYIDLNENAGNWAKKILEMPQNTEREKAYKILTEKGFDISIEAKKLESLYLSMG